MSLFRSSSKLPAASVRSIPPSPKEHRDALETVARLLRLYGDALFDTNPATAREAIEQCELWARQVQGAVPDDEASEATRVDWAGVVRFFRELRQQESEIVTGRSQELRDAIRVFARGFEELLTQCQSTDAATELSLCELLRAVDSADPAAIRDQASQVIASLQTAMTERKHVADRQRSELLQRIEALEAGTSSTRVDKATRLPTAEALLQHLEFLSSVSQLMANPPVLLLVAVRARSEQANADTTANLVADELLRRFFTREQYVARAGKTLLAAVLPATTLNDAVATMNDVLSVLRNLPSLSDVHTRAVAATLVPGESAISWWRRVYASLKSGGSSVSCRIAAVPATFEN